MTRELLVTGLVAALVVLAGCLGGGPATAPADPADGTPTDAPGTPDGSGIDPGGVTDGATTTPASGPGKQTASPDDADASVASGEPFSTSFAGLDSYTVSMEVRNVSVEGDEIAAFSMELLLMADTGDDRHFTEERLEMGGTESITEAYKPPETSDLFVRHDGESGVSYYRATSVGSTEDPFTVDSAVIVADRSYYRDAGVVETDQGPRHRYVIESVDGLPAATRGGLDGEFDSVAVEVLVDERRDLVTDYRFEGTVIEDGSAVPILYAFSVRDVDSTTVTPPQWLEAAREATGDQ